MVHARSIKISLTRVSTAFGSPEESSVLHATAQPDIMLITLELISVLFRQFHAEFILFHCYTETK